MSKLEISFEFEEGVKLTVDRVAGTKGYDCKVWASDRTAAIKGMCILVQELAENGGMSVEEVICRVAASLLAPAQAEGGGHVEAEKNS